ncbi:pleckstrin homology domain-containing family G member 4B-like [Scomber scombrus]|uniref:pleckstrin homology domain-containing family G member 4B-like n=1 Tax=Scomber scombrus TaxID=13677 RepID=UPI002DDB90C3|nr:pleckstrin homology domain-containing family G member 4B-like [Scomber scombrus]
MNPESLDSSIQSALSALFPPFEATAPVVLSQLFRTIEERYHGDALQCMLDFLIPSKHLLESVQQAACAGYSDVVFRCEGWPLCLHDKTVIQLAPVNPLLLRPGDFYLQVEPFGDQAARIVLKSLLEEGCREMEETPVPETSYPCIFTEDWLRDINEGRHGTPLSQCLLCTDQGVIKLPWAKIAIPEFLDKPKIMPTYQEAPPEPKQSSSPSHYNSCTLPLETMILPSKDRMSASLRPVDCSSKFVRVESEKRIPRPCPKPCPKPLIKPVGWVSPNTWDSRNYPEIEGDYVDLVDIAKRKEFVSKCDGIPNPAKSVLFKPVRPPPPVPLGNSVFCGHTLQYAEEPCTPCSQRKLGLEPTDQDLKCRYRDSYVAALRNPVPFEGASVDLLAALEEAEGELRTKGTFEAQRDKLGKCCNHCKEPMTSHELCQFRNCCEPTPGTFASHFKGLPTSSGSEDIMRESPMVFKSTPGLSYGTKVQTKLVSHQLGHDASVHPVSDVFLETCDSDMRAHQKVDVMKPSGKHKVKLRSLSTVSETPKGSPLLYKLSNRSHSDICPETISSIMQCKKAELLDQVTPKMERRKSPKKGSRDRTGRAVVEVHGDRKEWTAPLVSAQNLCELLLYLHSIPRKDVRELGMTLVINARKKTPSPHLYKALLMAQEQALHAVHSVLILVDKETCPRPEKQPGLQMDMLTSMKALNKTVEASQLTSDLGGTFSYSHTDWLQFHQRRVSFMTELQGADSLLQKAIKKVDDIKSLDTAQEVQLCIQDQRASMKEVLEDARLVTLQREGGSVLARMKREEFRFSQSEDYRDALESVTSLYNQVEENLHMLVMRSNESLQHLEFVFRLREMEAKISTAGTWFNTEGEQRLKDSYTTDYTLGCTEKTLQQFDLFLTQSKEKHQCALTLLTEAERILGTSDSSPATDIFRTLVSTFKSNMDEFMLRSEQRYKELDVLVHVYRFCNQVELGCYSAQACLSTLQMYEERLGGEFSTTHFQTLKAKACTVRSGASGVMGVWNAAWVQCQEVRQRVEEMQKKNTCKDKTPNQQATAVNTQGEAGGMKNNEERKTKWRPREHHSEADLRSTDSVEGADDFLSHKPLGRSLSEGSHASSHLTFASNFSPLNERHRHCQSKTQPLIQNQQTIQNPPTSHDQSLLLTCKSKRDSNKEEGGSTKGCTVSTQSSKDLRTPEILLSPTENNDTNVLKLRRIMEELLSTEREYVKALGYVREHYFPELERGDVPQDLRGQRGIIFGNLEKLHDFHRHHFLNELESCVNEPFRVGRCFLRHRESLALYALYSKNKPQSDSLLINHGQAFFKQRQLKLGDKMDLWSYLLKPIQRISKYSLLLQDMMRECGPGQTRELAEIKAALEVIHFQLRHGNNLLAMDAIHHCDVNMKEQGQLIRQDEFLVTFRKKKCFRHIFLFQELILFSKTRKTNVGNDTYIYKQSFKTSDIGMTQNSGDSGLCFEIWFRKRKTQDTYTIQAVSREVKEVWTKDLERILWEQAVHNREVRMQERVFMGIGNKPFMDIQPSDAAINDRAVNYVLMGRENKVMSSVGSCGSQDRLPGARPKSVGSGSTSSSSSSSGRGSLSHVGYLCGPKRKVVAGGLEGYVSPPGVLEEDDLDHESGSQNLLLDSSESSGESVSGFSSSSHSYHSALGGEGEDTSSVCASIITVREAHRTNVSAAFHKLNALAGSSEKIRPPGTQAQIAKPDQGSALWQGAAQSFYQFQHSNVGKSTEV